MKGKKFAIILFIIGFILLISGGVASFLFSLKEDRALTLERMVVVNDEFEEFSTSTTAFEAYRDELYNNVLSSLFYDTLGADDANIKNVLSNYEAMVDALEKKADSLNNLCADVYYPDSSVNSKCSNYKLIYEQVVNYFVGDVELYNKTLKTFNEQQTAAGSGVVIEDYKTQKKYIDYNKDKSYDGKEVD